MLRALAVVLVAWFLAGSALAVTIGPLDETRVSTSAMVSVQVDCSKRHDMRSCKVRCLASTASVANALNPLSASLCRDLPLAPAAIISDIIRAPQHAPPKLLQA